MELITALCQHGVCVSYNTDRRIDVDLAEQVVATAGANRVPHPRVFEATSPLNGELDNFDRNESTLARIGSSHNTILVLFQNVPLKLMKPPRENEISTRFLATGSRTTVKLTVPLDLNFTYARAQKATARNIHGNAPE